MQRVLATLLVLELAFLSACAEAKLYFDRHADFGHVPDGAEKIQTIMVCNTDRDESLLLDDPPAGFRLINAHTTLHFSEARCHELTLVFAPAYNSRAFTEYGNALGEEGKPLFLTGYNSQGNPVQLTSLSGTGLSRNLWTTLYPPDSNTYYYQTQIDFSLAEDFIDTGAPLVSSATFSASSEIIVSFRNSNLTKILLTDNQGKWDWSLSSNQNIAGEYCSLSLSPDEQWIAGGDAVQHKVDLYKARDISVTKTKPLSPSDSSDQSGSDQSNRLYRVCSTAFPHEGTHLLTLGSSIGNTKPTWLTAWQFDNVNGKLGQVTDQVQVGRITLNNYAQAIHGIAVSSTSAAQYVVASHQHLSRHPLDRFYFDSQSGKFIPVNQLTPKTVPGKLSMNANGLFVALVPFFPSQPMEIHQCYSAGCHLIQTVDKSIHPQLSFTPSDAQFAHHSDVLAVTEEDEGRLTILKPQNSFIRWEVHQALGQKEGLLPLFEPAQLAFSKDDRWLMVVSQSRLLIFARLQLTKIAQTIRWRSPPEWWLEYQNDLCRNDSSITSKTVCEG